MYTFNSERWRHFSHSASSSSIMEAILTSRKRHHPSSSRSNPLSGTFTRNRSQLFLHRSRSGLLRPDPKIPRHQPHAALPPSLSRTRHRTSETNENYNEEGDMVPLKDICKKTKLSRGTSSTGGDGELSRVLMKDLRARRVYSPQSSVGACSGLVTDVFAKGSGVDPGCGDRRIDDLGFRTKPSVESSGCAKEGSKMEVESGNFGKVFSSEGQKKDEVNSILRLVLNDYRFDKDGDMYVDDVTESSDSGLSPKVQNFGQGNTESSDEGGKLQDEKRRSGISSEKIDDSTEELVQTTPPDAEICIDSEVTGEEGKQVEEVPVKDMPFAGNAVENAGEGCRPKDSQRNDSVLTSKSVLRPRFQGKLFKAPGSVSFRRLFPFLKDMMGDDSGTPKLGHCQKDEKGMDGQESQLSLSSQSHEASKHELKPDSCSMVVTNQFEVSEGDAVVAPVNELSHGNGSELTSSHCLLEPPMQLHTKDVNGECLSAPSIRDKCLSKTKADSSADFHCVKEVGNDLHNDDFKQDSKHQDNIPDYAKTTNNGGCTMEQFGVLNEECVLTTPPDADTFDKQEVNKVGQLESDPPDMYYVKAMDLGRNTRENAGEGFCQKTDKSKDSILKSKSVPRSNLHRKLFINPGSVSYRRLLPFLMDFTKDEYDHQIYHKKDEADMYGKRFQLPLSSQSQEASIDEHKIDSGPVHDTVESNAMVNSILVDPTSESSHGNQPKLTSSQDLPELPMQLDAREMVHECLSVPSVNEHIEKVEIGPRDECLSESKLDPDSVMVDFHCVDNAANALHNVGFKQVQNNISREHNSESPPKAQNVLDIDGIVSNLTFDHYSSKEKGFSIDYDEGKQSESLENCKSVSRYPPQAESLDNSDHNMSDAEDKGKHSHAICRSDDAVVVNHVSVSNEEPRPSSEKIILEKSDMAGHCGQKAGSVLKGIAYGPRMPSKGRNNKNANRVSEVGKSSESKTTLVINRCSRMKLLKHAASYSYKRLLPYLSNTMKDSSCATANCHCPKVQKCLDQKNLLPISDSEFRVIPISDSAGCAPMKRCRGSSGTQQQTGLHACDLNNDSSSPIFEDPESQPSHDSCKVIQLQDEQVVSNSNGRCKLESSPDRRISDHKLDLPVTPFGPIAITREEEAPSALPDEVKGNSSFLISSNEEKSPKTYGCCQSLSQTTFLEQPRVSATGLKKGILKRNPRGCRGLCTCLNCASFRLHAERAFEFSRNQFLDAEEIAQDLVKELSHLRNILERSTDSVNDNPVFDGSQVKEACSKAFVTEQLAKDRFTQMNDDLNIHCRISNLQRPRVRFADHVEEKVIQSRR